VSFAAITLCVASQCLLLFISLLIQSGNFWVHLRILGVFESMVLRITFGPKREEI
jgi:hypothetical protein